MKKALAIILCVLCTLGACWTWAMADLWAESLNVSHLWFDAAWLILLFAAVCLNGLFNEQCRSKDGESLGGR